MPTPTVNVLQPEYEAYLLLKPKLLEQGLEGKVALVKNRQFVAVFDDEMTAYGEGLKRFGNVPLLIVRITKDEEKTFVPALVLGLLNAGVQ